MVTSTIRHHGRPIAAGLVLGATGAAAALGVDTVAPATAAITAGNARALLGSTFAAVVTIGAFAFWMRPLAVQLAASSVPPRTVAEHLHDGFQRRVVGAAVGALTFEAAVLLALPAEATDAAPLVASIAGGLLGVGAIAALLVAIEHAERSTQPSVLISESARRVVAQIRALDGASESAQLDRRLDGDDAAVVVAPASGWVRSIDRDGLLEAAPEGGVVQLAVDVGSFVVEGWTPVAEVIPSARLSDDVRGHLRQHFEIGERRDGSADLTGSLAQFTDIAVQAATGGSSAPSVVYEAFWYLGTILHEIVRRDLSAPDRTEAGGRVVLAPARDSGAALTDLAVDRIRQVTASSPQMALELVRVIRDVTNAAARAGRDDIVDVLERQADATVAQCRHAGGLPRDVERVAAARGWVTDDQDAPGSREEEYAAR